MAQILKEEVRDRIISSAREEFLKRDYEQANMRSIALRSRMTVGNLYRYFRSKEELSRFIVAPAYEKINQLIKDLTAQQISLEELHGPLNLSVEELKQMLDTLGDRLVDIFEEHHTEFLILMMHSNLNQSIRSWFADAIHDLILPRFPFESEEASRTISLAYATSIFEGLKKMFTDQPLPSSTLKRLVKIYLDSYIQILEKADFSRFHKETL